MQFRVVMLLVLLAVAAYLGRDTYAQYTFDPYQLHVCTGPDYAGEDDSVCPVNETTIGVHSEQWTSGVFLEVSDLGFHGTHTVSIQVQRAMANGSWASAPAWSVSSVPNTTASTTTWIYRPSLIVFWPPQWSNYPPHKTPTALPGTYRLFVVVDGQHAFSPYNLVIQSY